MPIKRRDFFKIIGGLAAWSAFPACTSAAAPKKLLENENKPGFYIRFYKPFKPVDIATWRLKSGGLCDNQLSFDISALRRLKKASQVSRLKCVECWSAKAQWGGFRPQTLFEIVKPKREAQFLYIHSADDYYEYIPMDVILHSRTLFAYEMNDKPLPDEHGAPLRLIIPQKYGYKSIKTITKLEFVSKGGVGYWSQFGYSPDATIEPGEDHPLDIGKTVPIKKPGELDY